MRLDSEVDTLAAAQRVLKTERDALEYMADHLPDEFSAVVDVILAAKGRVIVSAVGKSGHVGRKISATLASTGTPACFIHATEASHGDLGMVTDNDICLLISNSGETSELHDIINYTRRFTLPMIAMSSNVDSTLMKAADYRLVIPKAPEACSIGMAPTTSTTLMMALGDALAVVLMEKRKFQPEHFQVFHPGGRLGAAMMTVGQLMHKGDKLPLVTPETSMKQTLLEMTSKGFGIAAVVSDNRLIGVISDGDLRRHMDHLMTRTAGQIANMDPVTAGADDLAVEALKRMNDKEIGVLMVVEAAMRPVGIIHIHDFLRAGIS